MKKQECDTPLMFYPSRVYTRYEPLGPTLVIGSWNYPYVTTLLALVSAISAGNPCIIKPSEGNKTCSRVIKDIVDEMDQDYFACFEGDKDISVFLN